MPRAETKINAYKLKRSRSLGLRLPCGRKLPASQRFTEYLNIIFIAISLSNTLKITLTHNKRTNAHTLPVHLAFTTALHPLLYQWEINTLVFDAFIIILAKDFDIFST